MAIEYTNVRIAHDYDHKPGTASAAITDDFCALAVDTTQNARDGSIKMVKCLAASRARYVGVQLKPASAGEGVTAIHNTVLAGITGMTAGSPVYIAADGTLTHTQPGSDARIGIAATATLLILD